MYQNHIKQIFALVSCTLFLTGNVLYDRLGTEENAPDYRIFYIPLSVMLFSLILLAKDFVRKDSVLDIFWEAFLWLSFLWVVKFIGFNPFVIMLSDYLVLGIVIIRVTYKTFKKCQIIRRNRQIS